MSVNATISDDNVNSELSVPTNRSDDTYYYGLPTVLSFSILLFIIMIMALLGNILVITTILRNKDMRTRTNILLCNLAVADILTALLDIPVAIYTLNSGKWPLSDALCYFNGYLVGLGLMLSIHTLMWISIHKFISITRPLARSLTPGKIFCMIIAAWAWALLYNLGPLLGWTETVYKKGASQCGPVIPKGSLQVSHSVTNTLFNFIIPICVMFYCYYKIFAEVREHMNRLQDFTDTTIISSIMQQKRITKTLVIVFVCFILCWCPYIVYSTLLVCLGQEKVYPIFNPLAYLATYLNSACNPIIYALRSPSFRKGFKEILSFSKNVAHYSYGNSSYGWSRTKNGILVSFRRSLIRSRSEPGGVSDRRKCSKTEQMKDPFVSKKSLITEYKYRRINTLPKGQREPEEQTLPPISIVVSPRRIQDLPKSLELISPVQTCATPIIRTPVSSNIILNEELSSELREKYLLSPEKTFFDTPTPRDKKYFIYFPKCEKQALSLSAPNLCLNLDNLEDETHSPVTKEVECLKVPEALYTRAASEGDVKPLFGPHSCHSKSRLTESPKLIWQASLENINIGLLSQHHQKDIKPDHFQRRRRIASNSSQDSDRKSKLPNVINSVECLLNNIFSSDQNKRISNKKMPDNNLEIKSNSIFYSSVTDSKSVEENDALMSRL
ncbi:UNVERIFIED_CONTAM: hypothetical protein RMT77_010543 [Armadillidium vulgare]